MIRLTAAGWRTRNLVSSRRISRLRPSRLRTFLHVTLYVATGMLVSAGAASGQGQSVCTVLHSFAGGTDGSSPSTALIQATDQNFYGTTASGGTFSLGTVFKMTANGSRTVMHSFAGAGTDGQHPNTLIQATDGNFYGTCAADTVFKMTADRTVTVLYSFTGILDGHDPNSLIQATDGNFYGTTQSLPMYFTGSVFQLTGNGAEHSVTLFCNGDLRCRSNERSPNGLIERTDGR